MTECSSGTTYVTLNDNMSAVIMHSDSVTPDPLESGDKLLY